MLGADDPPPAARRILVAGVSGSGKTTLAGRLSAMLGIAHTELDGLHHGPAWTPRREFERDVEALAARDAWITEWQYRQVRERLAASADLLVWLDYPTWLTMLRVARRTISRRLRRTVLWNGNVEPPLATILTEPDHIIRWAWRTRDKYRDLPAALGARHPHLEIVRLRTPRETERWLARLGA